MEAPTCGVPPPLQEPKLGVPLCAPLALGTCWLEVPIVLGLVMPHLEAILVWAWDNSRAWGDNMGPLGGNMGPLGDNMGPLGTTHKM